MGTTYDPTGDPRYFYVPERGKLAPYARDFLGQHLSITSDLFHRSVVVGYRMRELLYGLGERHGAVLDAYEAMGLVHDIGHGNGTSGSHAFDGAVLLEEDARLRWLAPHVAWHSRAEFEYRERAIDASRYQLPPAFDHATLWVADVTVSPQGERVTPRRRLEEILERKGRDSLIGRATLASIPRLNRALTLHGEEPVEL